MSEAQISQLNIYPIKSSSGIHLNHAFVEQHGLAFDRRFVVCTPEGTQLTARTHPKLAQIHCALLAEGLHVKAPQMAGLDIKYAHFSKAYHPVKIWKDTVQAQHCHQDYDHWFSQYLGEPCQLMFFGEQSQRKVKQADCQVAFADGYPLLLLSEASLEDLNLRSSIAHSMEQFRPNLVVKDTSAFAEDGWKRFRIGEVEFEVQNPCSRCIFTTLDQTSGQFNPQKEPLTTLAKYRKGEDGNVYFGQNVVALNRGKISLYDPIEVLEMQAPEHYPNHAPQRAPSASSVMPVENWAPGQTRLLQCIAVQDETHDVKTFFFEAPPGKSCHYLAGQYIGLELTIDGRPVRRNYTLSSAPSRPQRLAITVKRVPNGLASNWLHQHLKPGMQVKALAPAGDFHLPATPSNKLLLLSAGSGITPMLSMLRYLSDINSPLDVIFFHCAHSEQDLIARAELAYLSQQLAHCSVRYSLTQTAHRDWSGYQGRLNRGMLLEIEDLEQRSVFVCGPEGFMESAKQQLLALGVHPDDYFSESFGHPVSQALPRKDINILFDSWDTYIQGNNQQNILEQAEQAGLNITYSCRGGFCGACKVKLDSGQVTVLEDSGLSEEEKQQGYVLSCSCIPQSDLSISQA